jgi:hypothetical protein
MIYAETERLIKSLIKNMDSSSNFFTTMAGSKTLAMLASFLDGRDIIKQVLMTNTPISICSYARSIADDPDDKSNEEHLTYSYTDSMSSSSSSDVLGWLRRPPHIYYRDSPQKCSTCEYDWKTIAAKENVLTVLVDHFEYDMYNVLVNRVLLDSKKLGPGCLSALTDAILFLQEVDNTGTKKTYC